MRRHVLALVLTGFLLGCGAGVPGSGEGGESRPPELGPRPSDEPILGQMEVWKMEIMKQDRQADFDLQFVDLSSRSAFFAPEGSIIEGGVGEIKGRESIQEFHFDGLESGSVVGLTWAPDRAEVSRSGDLGYTVGQYLVGSVDDEGTRTNVEGRYVTIWRRQADSVWLAEMSLRVPTKEPVVDTRGGPGGG